MANKKTVVILSVIGGIIVVIGVALLIALNVINGKIEKEVTTQLDSAIRSSGMEENVSYGEVKAQAASGRLTITEFSFEPPMGGSKIDAVEISVKIPPTEATALANDPQKATLSKAEIAANDLVMADPSTGSKTQIGSISIAAEGELSQQLMQGGMPEFLQKVSSFKMSVKDSTFSPGEQFMMQMQMVPGASALVSEGAMNVKSMDIDADVSPERMNIKKLSLDSGLVTFDGNMDLKLNELMQPKDVAAELSVDKLHEELRANLAPMFEQMGQPLPDEGSFKLNIKLPEGGKPEITVE